MGRVIRRIGRRLRPSSTFWTGFWNGLAAPTLLYESQPHRPGYHDANEMIANAWSEVGRHMWTAIGTLDKQAGRHRD